MATTVWAHTGFEHGYHDPLLVPNNGNAPVSETVIATDGNTGSRCLEVVLSGSDDFWIDERVVGNRSVNTAKVVGSIALKVLDDGLTLGEAFYGNQRCPLVLGTASSSTNSFCGVAIESDGAVSLYVHNSSSGIAAGTLLGTTAAGEFTLGDWHTFEIEVAIADSGGTAKLWHNGALVVDFTGDTEPGSGTPNELTMFTINLGSGFSGNMPTYRIDDFWIGEGDALGPISHEALVPTSNSESDGTGSDGNSVNNYELVDEIPFASADYVDLTTAADRERYGHAGRADTGTPVCASMHGQVHNPDGGQIIVKSFVENNGSEDDGDSLGLVESAQTRRLGLFLTDPDGGGAWTGADIDAATFGVEVVST